MTGFFQTDTYRIFSIRLPAYNIFHALPSISGELFSSLDILLRVAMKLINWGECYLTVNKPLDLCPLSSKFRHSVCKAFSVPYPTASLPSLFTAPWWYLFASSGPSSLSSASLQSLVAACSPSQFVRIRCLTAAVPPPASHHQKPPWGFLPGPGPCPWCILWGLFLTGFCWALQWWHNVKVDRCKWKE